MSSNALSRAPSTRRAASLVTVVVDSAVSGQPQLTTVVAGGLSALPSSAATASAPARRNGGLRAGYTTTQPPVALPTEATRRRARDVASRAAEQLRSAGIAAVVWDFDLTLLRIHAFGLGIQASAVPARDLEADFRDLFFTKELMNALVLARVPMAIASFGRYDVIEAYLRAALSDHTTGSGKSSSDSSPAFSRNNIITCATVGGIEGVTMREGKNAHLEWLRQHALSSVSADAVLFFDDDASNIGCAQEAGEVCLSVLMLGGRKGGGGVACL